jgi:hypothetical protein
MVNGFACFLRNEASNQEANDHNGLVASAKFAAFGAAERNYPGNRAPARSGLYFSPKIKMSTLV